MAELMAMEWCDFAHEVAEAYQIQKAMSRR